MILTGANQFINKHSCHHAPSLKFTAIYGKLCDFITLNGTIQVFIVWEFFFKRPKVSERAL
jgi:hypothetical protein